LAALPIPPGIEPGDAHAEIVETREDRIMLWQRGVLFQVGGKFPRMTGATPEEKLAEIRKVLQLLQNEVEG
jgi:hypothetical protein